MSGPGGSNEGKVRSSTISRVLKRIATVAPLVAVAFLLIRAIFFPSSNENSDVDPGLLGWLLGAGFVTIVIIFYWVILDNLGALDEDFLEEWMVRPIDRLINIGDENWKWDDAEWRSIATSKVVDYDDYLDSEEWAKKRTYLLKKVGYKCQNCSSRRNLQVHHLTYKRVGRERTTDLQVLCRNCHEIEHDIY